MAYCEACGKSVKARGLCNAHYQLAKSRAIVDLFERKNHPLKGRQCTVPECNRECKGRLYCSMHSERLRVTGDVGDAAPRKAPSNQQCSVDGCGNMAKARSYCIRHYQRWKACGDPGPVERIRRARGTGSIQDGYLEIAKTREHRRVWEESNGPIPYRMVIHHINGDKLDNRIENLEPMTRSGHMKLHKPRPKTE